jgi:uncharacterized membrane protein YfcA
MEIKQEDIAVVRRVRTALVIGGTVVGYASFLFTRDAVINSMLAVALLTSVFGCYLWAKLKNRHWMWMVFGLLAPVGFLMLAFLSDKSQKPPDSSSGSV